MVCCDCWFAIENIGQVGDGFHDFVSMCQRWVGDVLVLKVYRVG